MHPREKPGTGALVRAGQQALVLRSAALVARGLRDLTRDSNWVVKKIFTGYSSALAISGLGHVCFVSRQFQRGGRHRTGDLGQRVVLYDLEMSTPMIALSVPDEVAVGEQDLAGVFAWSPSTRFLVAAWNGWQPALHSFDLHGKMLLGTFGEFGIVPQCLAWSGTEKYFVEACAGGKQASLRLWRVRDDGMSLQRSARGTTYKRAERPRLARTANLRSGVWRRGGVWRLRALRVQPQRKDARLRDRNSRRLGGRLDCSARRPHAKEAKRLSGAGAHHRSVSGPMTDETLFTARQGKHIALQSRP